MVGGSNPSDGKILLGDEKMKNKREAISVIDLRITTYPLTVFTITHPMVLVWSSVMSYRNEKYIWPGLVV